MAIEIPLIILGIVALWSGFCALTLYFCLIGKSKIDRRYE